MKFLKKLKKKFKKFIKRNFKMNSFINTQMSRTDAFRRDKELQAKKIDGEWCVVGVDTEYCYKYSLPSEDKAKAYADELQNNKKNLYVD